MGIFDFLFNKSDKEQDNIENIWDKYTSEYFDKYDLAIELRDLTKNKVMLKEILIEKIMKIERLIPNEVLEINEEVSDIDLYIKNIYREDVQNRFNDVMSIHKNKHDVIDDPKKLLSHMKEALKLLAETLNAELILIRAIKANPENKQYVIELFQLISNREKNLVIVFGSELRGDDYKNIESIIVAVLKKKEIKIQNPLKHESIIDNDSKRKKRIELIITELYNILKTLDNDTDLEFIYERYDKEPNSARPLYFIFLHDKKNIKSKFLIMSLYAIDIDKRVSKDDISNIRLMNERIIKGIRILRRVSKL